MMRRNTRIHKSGSDRSTRRQPILRLLAAALLAPFLGAMIFIGGDVWAGDGTWTVTARVNSAEYLPREPILVTYERLNKAEKTESVIPLLPKSVSVSVNGTDSVEWRLFTTSFEDVGAMVVPPVEVEPGKVHSATFWILLGKVPGVEEWSFLTEVPGNYSLSFPGANAPVEFRVVGTNGPSSGITEAGAAVFLGEIRGADVEKGKQELKRLITDEPNSPYAPYAGIGMAGCLWRTSKSGDLFKEEFFSEYSSCLKPFVAPGRTSPVRDEAIYLLAKGYQFQRGKKREVYDLLKTLAGNHPGSRFVPKIKSEFGVDVDAEFSPAEPAAQSDNRPAKIDFPGIAQIPEDLRLVFIQDRQDFADRRVENAVTRLSPEYLGDHGGAEARKKHWEWCWDNHNIQRIDVSVEKVETVSSYTRPATMQAEEKTWDGTICVVLSRVSIVATELKKGESASPSASSVVTVFRLEGSEWRIISDGVAETTANTQGALLCRELIQKMSVSLADVVVWDGKVETSLYDVVKAEIPVKADDVLLSWEFDSLTMKGAKISDPEINGIVTVVDVEGKAGNALKYMITLQFVLDGDRLRLSKVSSAPYEKK